MDQETYNNLKNKGVEFRRLQPQLNMRISSDLRLKLKGRNGSGHVLCLPSLEGAMALSSHSRLVEVREVKECRDRLSELGSLSSKSSRFWGL